MGGDLLAANSRETRDALARWLPRREISEKLLKSLARRNTFAELPMHLEHKVVAN